MEIKNFKIIYFLTTTMTKKVTADKINCYIIYIHSVEIFNFTLVSIYKYLLYNCTTTLKL